MLVMLKIKKQGTRKGRQCMWNGYSFWTSLLLLAFAACTGCQQTRSNIQDTEASRNNRPEMSVQQLAERLNLALDKIILMKYDLLKLTFGNGNDNRSV